MAIVMKLEGDLATNGKTYLRDTIVNQTASPILQASDSHQNHIPAYRQVGTAVAATSWLYTIRGAQATFKAVKAGLLTACLSGATVTIDVKKNGTTILSSTIGLSDSESDRDEIAGTLSVTSAVAGDIIEVVVTVAAGGGTLGVNLFVWLDLNENYAAS